MMPTATAAEPGQRLGLGGLPSLLRAAAARPVAADSVAVFRIGFGLLVAFSAIRFLAKGWVARLYIEPEHHLSYLGFEWISPLPSFWMHAHLVVLATLGLCIAVGYRTRLATTLFILGFTYTELIEASLYLNHYWFVTLVAVLLLLLPVHHHWSLDARAGRVRRSDVVPVGIIWALRAQVGLVYFFAGLAKLNPDWLFHAQPLRLWLADRTHVPLLGPLLEQPETAFALSWASVIFDLTVVGWLVWRRSRKPAYLLLVVFHLSTGALFQIGIFPWVMIFAALIFFEPDWPSQHRLSQGERSGIESAPKLGKAKLYVLAIFAVLQIALPLRHYAYPNNVRWTEEGYYLSWRVMLTDKAGYLDYRVTDPASGRTWEVSPDLVLTDWQENHASTRPALVHATAKLIAEHYERAGIAGVEVRANSWVSINGRVVRRLIDSTVDLAREPRRLSTSEWIIVSA